MSRIVSAIEALFVAIPLPLLEVWGRFVYLLGFALAIAAFGGLTFRPGGRWGLGRERQSWDQKAFLSIPLTFVLIVVSGYIGSSIVLVPGAQTFESLKDLMVFLCILLFGYPALIAVPFAYGLSDLIEGVPPGSLWSWLPGYFINPTCFWIASQLFGKNPDFRRARTWGLYLIFVALFMSSEPVLWGYICAGEFTPAVSYRTITPALFFTTGVTWIMAPFAMLIALPAARKLGFFWAEIPGHTKERVLSRREWVWESGRKESPSQGVVTAEGWPIRMALVTPFIALVLLMVGATSYVTLHSAEIDAKKLATRLHQEISDNINLRLDLHLATDSAKRGDIRTLLKSLPVAEHGLALVVRRSGGVIASSAKEGNPVADLAVTGFAALKADAGQLKGGLEYQFDRITAKPLSRVTWLARATSYEDLNGKNDDLILLTVMPESYYLAGVRTGNSRSALIFAIALLLSLTVAGFLAALVTGRLLTISTATQALAQGDLTQRVPGSRLVELDSLSRSFNEMAAQLKNSIDALRAEVETRKGRERELEESEAKVRTSEERLQLALQGGRLAIWDWDIAKDRLDWDDSMFRLYGVRRENFGGAYEAWNRCVLPEDADRARGDVQAALKGEREFASEFRVRTEAGSIRHIRGVAKTLRDESGRPFRMVGLNWDVTEQVMAERVLRERETFLRLAQEAAHVGSWEWDIAANRFKWSEELARIHGIGGAEFDGKPETVLAFCHPRDADRLRQVMLQMSGGADLDKFECRIVRRDGVERDLWFLGQIHRDERGTPSKVLGIAIDITERRKLEQQFRQAQKMEALGHLAAGVAHDFNNLLTVIIGQSDLLLDRVGPESDLRAELELIAKTGDRAAALTGQLLAFSRKTVLQPTVLSINEVVKDTEGILRRTLGEDVLLKTRLAPGAGKLKADLGQLTQALLNLSVNARDAMPQGGKLTIETAGVSLDEAYCALHPPAKPGAYILLTVTDTGSGMTPEVKARLFEPFFTTKGVGKGTGLGLSMVYGIVDQSGGHIEVVSDVGRGTTFKLYFPALEVSTDLSAKESKAAPSTRGGETVLLVEDEPGVRAVSLHVLKSQGYQVLVAADGAEALRIAGEQSNIDALVTDVVMPGLSGREVSEALQKRFPGLKILFVSGYTDDAIVRHGVMHDGVNFLQKPFRPAALASKLREVLDGRPAAR